MWPGGIVDRHILKRGKKTDGHLSSKEKGVCQVDQ